MLKININADQFVDCSCATCLCLCASTDFSVQYAEVYVVIYRRLVSFSAPWSSAIVQVAQPPTMQLLNLFVHNYAYSIQMESVHASSNPHHVMYYIHVYIRC